MGTPDQQAGTADSQRDAAIAIGVLGRLQVTAGEEIIDVAGTRQQRLLARLALASGHAVGFGRLAEAIWGDRDQPADVVSSIRSYVCRLRNCLGRHEAAVVTVDHGYRLDPSRVVLDRNRFVQLTRDAADARAKRDHQASADLIETALELWRGPFLEPWQDEPWVLGEAHRFREIKGDACEAAIDAYMASDRSTEAIHMSRRVSLEFPHREQPVCRLALLLAQSGRTADAVAELHRLRRRLAEDLGLMPTPQVAMLEQAVLGSTEGGSDSHAALSTTVVSTRFDAAVRTRRPRQVTA